MPPLAHIYSGPYCIQHAGPKVFMLEVGSTLKKVMVEHLKPHTSLLLVVPAIPAKWGRPRKENLASN